MKFSRCCFFSFTFFLFFFNFLITTALALEHCPTPGHFSAVREQDISDCTKLTGCGAVSPLAPRLCIPALSLFISVVSSHSSSATSVCVPLLIYFFVPFAVISPASPPPTSLLPSTSKTKPSRGPASSLSLALLLLAHPFCTLAKCLSFLPIYISAQLVSFPLS